MATPNDTETEFRTDYEQGCISAPDTREPALIFNRKAGSMELAAAALARSCTLHKMLFAWCCTDPNSTEVSASDVASALEPLAQEIEIICRELIAVAAREAAHV